MWPSDFIGIITKCGNKYVWVCVPGVSDTRGSLLWKYKLDPKVKIKRKATIGQKAYFNSKGLIVLQSKYKEKEKI